MSYYINGVKKTDYLQLIADSNALDDSFIEGNTSVVGFRLDAKFTRTLTNLRCFPNLKNFVIANTERVIEIDDATFTGTKVLTEGTVYVANNLLTDWQTAHPSWNIATFQFQNEFEIPFIGETTLTAEYIEQVVSMAGGLITAVTKVIVPVGFTAYESGSINAIISAFANIEHLVSCYENGNVDLDLQGDIVAKILSLNKTLDDVLVDTKSRDTAHNYSATTIVPPIPNGRDIAYMAYANNANIVLFPQGGSCTMHFQTIAANQFMRSNNLLEVHLKGSFTGFHDTFYECRGLKRVYITQENDATLQQATLFGGVTTLEEVIWNNCKTSFSISGNNGMTRESLVDLFNSLGTPETTQTLTIGATNLAKLTAEDIAIATVKNWQVQ